ncbi:hypothetical protein [Natronorubrum daqingense]|nr:hypothetical protein [Natronorubrum daqingense]APX97521.1 hypothetical protein BB347_13400 [Natronorubrum daqingense]
MKAVAATGASAVAIPGVAAADPTDGGDPFGPPITTNFLEYFPIDYDLPIYLEFQMYDNCSFEMEIDAGTLGSRRETWECDPDGESCEEVSLDAGPFSLGGRTCTYGDGVADGVPVEQEITYCTPTVDNFWVSEDCETIEFDSVEIEE